MKQFVVSTIGTVYLGIVINFFLWQNKLIGGGFVGIALVSEELLTIPSGTMLWVLNVGVLVLAFIISGKTTGIKAVYGFTLLSIVLNYSRSILEFTQTENADYTQSFFIMILTGLLIGTGLAIILVNDYSVGAMSTFYFVIKKYINITPQALFFIVDLFVGILTAVTLGFEKGLLVIVVSSASYVSIKLSTPAFKIIFKKAK